jgi:hypothetical protein
MKTHPTLCTPRSPAFSPDKEFTGVSIQLLDVQQAGGAIVGSANAISEHGEDSNSRAAAHHA